jgi:RNA-binding protein YlmH
MERQNDRDLDRLLARIEELCDRAVRGLFSHTSFLTPREAKHARALLIHRGQWHRARLWGGYSNAERVCLLLFPDYVCDLIGSDAWHDTPVPELLAMAGEEDVISVLSLRGSGYRTLTHRDFLGSLLSLGIEREVLGDIAVTDDGHSAILFCTCRMESFLHHTVERIGGDVVRVAPTTVPHDFDGGRHYAPVRDTIASPRLDCIVAALCHLSRDAAQTAIRAGLVEVDYDGEDRVDVTVDIPCVISVRGVGKFALRSLGAPNRRGRLPLMADKYI